MGKPRVFLDLAIGSKMGGRLVFELYTDMTPRTAENFRLLCTGEKGKSWRTGHALHYLKSCIFRVEKGVSIQGGDIVNNNGTGSESAYGGYFEDEDFSRKHTQAGVLSMSNSGPNTNGSQFYITLGKLPSLDRTNVVFGQLVEGMAVLRAVERVPVDGKECPRVPIIIVGCGELERIAVRVTPIAEQQAELEMLFEAHEKKAKGIEPQRRQGRDDGSDSEMYKKQKMVERKARAQVVRKTLQHIEPIRSGSVLAPVVGLLPMTSKVRIYNDDLSMEPDDMNLVKQAENNESNSIELNNIEERTVGLDQSQEGGIELQPSKEQGGQLYCQDDQYDRADEQQESDDQQQESDDQQQEFDEKQEQISGENSQQDMALKTSLLEDGRGNTYDDENKRVHALKLRLLQSRNLNRQETVNEKINQNRKRKHLLPENMKKTKDDDKKPKNDLPDPHKLFDPAFGYLNDQAFIGKKKMKRAMCAENSIGWDIFGTDALYRAHNKRIKNTPLFEKEYDTQKSKLGDTFYDQNCAWMQFQPSEVAKDRLKSLTEETLKNRTKFSRRRAWCEEEDVSYINQRNRRFNQKLERAFGPYSLEIRQNLERGTAL